MRQDSVNPARGHRPRAFSRPGGRAAKAAGFTLLEMIVVLAILGLATALVGPSAIRGIDSWRRQAELDSVLDQVRALPGNARASGRAIAISDASLKGKDAPLRVAAEWTLGVPKPWKVSANGVCQGGEITIGNRHGSRTMQVGSPFCDPILRP